MRSCIIRRRRLWAFDGVWRLEDFIQLYAGILGAHESEFYYVLALLLQRTESARNADGIEVNANDDDLIRAGVITRWQQYFL